MDSTVPLDQSTKLNCWLMDSTIPVDQSEYRHDGKENKEILVCPSPSPDQWLFEVKKEQE